MKQGSLGTSHWSLVVNRERVKRAAAAGEIDIFVEGQRADHCLNEAISTFYRDMRHHNKGKTTFKTKGAAETAFKRLPAYLQRWAHIVEETPVFLF